MPAINSQASPSNTMPGEGIDIAKMPGHWVLARLGKRVLRPGGVELTRWMIDSLGIGQDDRVVEFAPGMGRTAQLVLEQNPAVYTAVERDASATEIVQKWLNVDNIRRRVFNGSAQQSGLPDACASVLYVEAMLTMASTTHRKQIIEEAFRVLEPGGRFALHEVALTQATANAPGEADHVRKTLTHSIHHKVHPVLINQWIAMLEEAGFEIQKQKTAPMTLLEPSRIIRDEGLLGAARFLFRLLTRGPERRRVLEMRRAFRSVRPHMTALSLIAVKPS